MSPAEIDRFTELLAASANYLEFGCGGSTLLAARAGVRAISVEADPDWLLQVAADETISRAVEAGRLTLHYADIGPVGRWSRPKSTTPRAAWARYWLSVWSAVEEAPDLVLVDGRFRAACAIVSLMASPTALVLVHDYDLKTPIRRSYGCIDGVGELVDLTDTLATFKRGADFDPVRALAMLNGVANTYQ
jgi:hypothetical protein